MEYYETDKSTISHLVGNTRRMLLLMKRNENVVNGQIEIGNEKVQISLTDFFYHLCTLHNIDYLKIKD